MCSTHLFIEHSDITKSTYCTILHSPTESGRLRWTPVESHLVTIGVRGVDQTLADSTSLHAEVLLKIRV